MEPVGLRVEIETDDMAQVAVINIEPGGEWEIITGYHVENGLTKEEEEAVQAIVNAAKVLSKYREW